MATLYKRKPFYAGLLCLFAFNAAEARMQSLDASQTEQTTFKVMTVDEVLTHIARNANRQLPAKMDAETDMLEMVVQGKKLRYITSYRNYAAAELDVPALRALAEAPAIDSICSSRQLQLLMQQGASFSYQFVDNRRTPLFEIVIERQDCGVSLP